jgi:hypothetical protein
VHLAEWASSEGQTGGDNPATPPNINANSRRNLKSRSTKIDQDVAYNPTWLPQTWATQHCSTRPNLQQWHLRATTRHRNQTSCPNSWIVLSKPGTPRCSSPSALSHFLAVQSSSRSATPRFSATLAATMTPLHRPSRHKLRTLGNGRSTRAQLATESALLQPQSVWKTMKSDDELEPEAGL